MHVLCPRRWSSLLLILLTDLVRHIVRQQLRAHRVMRHRPRGIHVSLTPLNGMLHPCRITAAARGDADLTLEAIDIFLLVPGLVPFLCFYPVIQLLYRDSLAYNNDLVHVRFS